MMISPEAFYEDRLKGKTKEEIMTVIRGLKNEIGRLKNIVENPFYDSREVAMCPSEHTQISCSRLYLERAKQALKEVGGEYIPSAAEKKAMEFNDNIPYVKKVVFSIGGFFGGYETKTYIIDGDKVRVSVSRTLDTDPSDENGKNEEMDKDDFLDHLDSLNIGEWRRKYDTFRFGCAVMDGTQWHLEIYFSNGHRPVKFHGSNAYPYNFDSALDLFGN